MNTFTASGALQTATTSRGHQVSNQLLHRLSTGTELCNAGDIH